MLYNEFKKTYKTTLKKYPDTSYLYTDNEEPEKIFDVIITHQEKHGKTWKTVEEKTEKADFIYYFNVVDVVKFFRNLGGTETVQTAYTKAGYIPTRIISTSPGKDQRTIREFIYIK